jgi:CBS-domain-containing membrane protein
MDEADGCMDERCERWCAQPYALIVGSVVGACVGTLLSLFATGLAMAVLAAMLACLVITLIRAFHPPAVALAMYPLLFHPGNWFPLVVVLPFTVIAVCFAAILSRLVDEWPAYPKRLQG